MGGDRSYVSPKIDVLILIALIALLTLGCEEEDAPPVAMPTIVCSDDATPTILPSKLDDEDGDGNPLDEAFPDIDDEDDDIADHTWIRDRSGVYHLFYHNEGRGAPHFIEHYTSRDLQSIDYVGVALAAPPSGWDAGGLWAPHVIRWGNLYYMIYTGLDRVGADAKQRIGVATSTDLVSWTRLPVNNCGGTKGEGCVYECRESWTTWGMPGDILNDQCRDPFVIRDTDNDRWLLFATARSTNMFAVVTVASSENLSDWIGGGFIAATQWLAGGVGAQTTGGQAENPFVVSHAGDYYLLFTDWQDTQDSLDVANPRTIVQYATSSALTADSLGSAGWTYRGYTPDPGVNATEIFEWDDGTSITSQSLSSTHSGYVKPIRRQLILRCIEWNGDLTFDTSILSFAPAPSATLISSP